MLAIPWLHTLEQPLYFENANLQFPVTASVLVTCYLMSVSMLERQQPLAKTTGADGVKRSGSIVAY